MTHTLVTMLGRAGTDRNRRGYRSATYRFPNGATDTTAFFGLALARHLRPDQLVILGTSASHWSVLVEHLAGQVADAEDARLALLDAEDQGAVTQTLLDQLTPVVERQLECAVRPRMIPFGIDDDEQYAILRTVAETVKEGELSFDVTHGFRHFGMIGFLSASMLEQIHHLDVRGLWYGALDMTSQDVTPVLRLDGLMGIRRWVGALDRFDATGDYGVFAPLLQRDGVAPDKADCLRQAAFLERTLNVRDAARAIKTFLPVLDAPLRGASELFRGPLRDRLGWVRKGQLAERYRALAEQYLERGDFVRAAMFGKEACVERMLADHSLADGRAERFDQRKAAVEEAEGRLDRVKADPYWRLTRLRNALAHGTPPAAQADQRALRAPEALRTALATALRRFFS